MQRDRTLILAKVEATYGTDPTPTPAANAILAEGVEVSAVGRRLERGAYPGFMGKIAPVNIGEAVRVRFTTEIKGKGGAVDVPPEIGVLFKGCNFTETINIGVSVIYLPNSNISGNTSIAIYAYQHDILHKILGARGTFSGVCVATEYTKITWEFTGIYAGPADQSIPAGTFATTIPPRFLSASFAFDAYAAVINSFNFDIGNAIAKRVDANSATGIKEWLITNREPRGSIDPEMVTVATKDLWGYWSASTQAAITATIGSATGNKCVIDAPKAVLDVPSYGDRENWLILNCPFSLHPTAAGNDELKFTFS
jgi:hypothetical protein